MEKEALSVWDRQTTLDKDKADSQKKDISDGPSPSHHQSSEPRTDSEKGEVAEPWVEDKHKILN